jgi:hypothetical protein
MAAWSNVLANQPVKTTEIRQAIEAERNVSIVLYLMPSSSLMANVAQYFHGSERRIYFGMVDEFKQLLLDTKVSENSRTRSITLRNVLVGS